MKQYVGLDVSMKETSICIVDKGGKVIREVKVATEPSAILAVLMDETFAIERIGLEAGAFSQWLYGVLAEANLPVVCVETRHMKAALSAQRNKTDRNDARGIAQMMRVGLYRPVHVKTLTSQKQRMLLTARQLLKAKAIDIESDLRGTLRNFGLKVGVVGEAKFEARIRELIKDDADLAEIVEPVLIARRALREQLGVLHRQLLELARHDHICRRLMTAPGVGPVVALTFRATVDVPSRFKNSKTVGAAFGLTPRQYQSGETDRMGGVSKCGDRMMRVMLFEAALALMACTRKWSWLKAWGMKIARHRGMKRAIVAVARRLAVVLHRMWVDGTDFRWTRPEATMAASLKVSNDGVHPGTSDHSSVRACAVKPCALRRTASRLRGIDGLARPSKQAQPCREQARVMLILLDRKTSSEP